MKRLFFIAYFLMSTFCVFSAVVNGRVNIDELENFGVFVYVEDLEKYDITNEEGEFSLEGFEIGKTYTLIFQKDNLPDYKRVLKVSGENTLLEVNIKSKGKDSRQIFKGKVKSEIRNKDIFIKLYDKAYGIVARPNREFETKLEIGKYKGEVFQEGSISKKVNFLVEELLEGQESKKNRIDLSLKVKNPNNLTLKIANPVSGQVFLYQGEDLKFTKTINRKSKEIKINDLEEAYYTLKVKAYGKKDYTDKVFVKKSTEKKLRLNKLNKNENIYVSLFPDIVDAQIKIYDENALIKTVKSVKGLAIIEKLSTSKSYKIKVEAKKHKIQEFRGIKAGEKIEVALLRDIKGTLISGNIYPFNSKAEVMLLDKGSILKKVKVDKNGYYEIETDKIITGRKILRVKAEGFKEIREIRTINKGKIVKNLNFELKPFTIGLKGKVELERNLEKGNKNVLVIIDELKLWQFTNNSGEYYFQNIPEGTYTIIYKKLGYVEERVKLNLEKNKDKTKNLKLKARAKLIVRSNLKAYDLKINKKKLKIKSLVYEKFLPLGRKEITAKKKGYLLIKRDIKLTEAGEIKELKFDFINEISYRIKIRSQLEKISELLGKMEIKKAEKKLYELMQDKNYVVYKSEVIATRNKVKNLKKRLFNIDRDIKKDIEKLKYELVKLEKSDLGFMEKRKKRDIKYKEAVDFLEKILVEKNYTTLKSEIYVLKGEIYTKLGMLNSAKMSYRLAKEYKK